MGPLEVHQDVAPDRAAAVHQEVLKHGPCFQAVPPDHMPAGDTQLEWPQYQRGDIGVRHIRYEQWLG